MRYIFIKYLILVAIIVFPVVCLKWYQSEINKSSKDCKPRYDTLSGDSSPTMHHCINRLLSNEQFFRFSAIGVRKGGSWKETTEGARKGTRKPEREGERSESEVEGARGEVASDGKDVWREGRKGSSEISVQYCSLNGPHLTRPFDSSKQILSYSPH